jgi:hypothetical protein
MVDEDIEPHGIAGFVQNEALTQEPGHDTVVVGLKWEVFGLHLVAGYCGSAGQPSVRLERAAHLEADDHVDGRCQFHRSERVPHDMRLPRQRVCRDLNYRLGHRQATAQAGFRDRIGCEQQSLAQECPDRRLKKHPWKVDHFSRVQDLPHPAPMHPFRR